MTPARQYLGNVAPRQDAYSSCHHFKVVGLLVRTCQEIFLTAHGNPAEVIEAIGRDIPLIAGISAANTITPTEVMDIMLGTRDAIKDCLERRREKARAEGRTEGQTETQAEWLAWYHRMREAQEQGLPFDEPPPGN